MIASGELFLLNGETGGELRPLPSFLNTNIRVVAANFDRVYIACEPPVCPSGLERRPCTVWRFQGDNCNPVECPEFKTIEESIRQIAIGEKHLLVLTDEGTAYSWGTAVCGSTGHGGARNVPEFKAVPALKGRKVKLVAAGPYYSIAITQEGDVFSWGQAFNGETGIFGQVEAVPRFAPEVTKLRVTEVSCGHGHVLARTEAQQCVSWGENTCGQLGLGQKSKPTYKPQVLASIPSQVQKVSAGWAHSMAVGSDGRAYAWGLNSHGQLGLGDTSTRLAPELLQELVGRHHVASAHAAKALSLLRTAESRVLLCGQVPSASEVALTPDVRRPGECDPPGCVLTPVPLIVATGYGFGNNYSEISHITAFNRGGLGLARSTVHRVVPNLAPVLGGTQVRAYVTGLPFELHGPGADTGTPPVQDTIPLKVQLRSAAPACDCIVPGSIVDVDTVEFTSPDVSETQLGDMVEEGDTLAVQVRVSIDGGLTWTPDRHEAPRPEELDRTQASLTNGKGESRDVKKGLKDLKKDFTVSRKLQKAARKGSTVLWYCQWPSEGLEKVEPCCAPVTGGAELLLHVELPQRMPAEHLVVKFLCDPLHSIGDAELEGTAPLRRDVGEMVNACEETVAKLPLVGPLEVPVCGWLDPGGRGIRCISPPLDAEIARFYEYSVQLSLDGHTFLERCLPFAILDLRLTGLEPALGPVMEDTEVKIKATGLVETDVQKVRVDFPKELGRDSQLLDAWRDPATGDISFMMKSLKEEAKRRAEETRPQAELAAAAAPQAAEGEPPATEGAEEPEASEPHGGLHGLQVCVELSLNGQNFTEDGICFTFHGSLAAEAVQVLAPPEGDTTEAPKEEPKAKKGKGAVEEPVFTAVKPGSKLGCAFKPSLETEHAVLRMELDTKVGEDDAQPFRDVDMPGKIELITPAAPPPEPDVKGKKEPPPEAMPAPEPIEMLTALVPEVKAEDLPEGAVLLIRGFRVSLNGQSFTPCAESPQPMRLELPPPETENS